MTTLNEDPDLQASQGITEAMMRIRLALKAQNLFLLPELRFQLLREMEAYKKLRAVDQGLPKALVDAEDWQIIGDYTLEKAQSLVDEIPALLRSYIRSAK